jgi:hypothetical protein
VCWSLRGGRGIQYTKKTLKIYRKTEFYATVAFCSKENAEEMQKNS